MKSPQQLAVQLARQWQSSHWRTQHLLPGTGAWPLRLAIGAPDSQTFRHAGAALRGHLQQWQAIHQAGPGSVQWEARSYRGAPTALEVPTHWVLSRPSEYIAAISQFAAPQHTEVAADYHALAQVLPQVDDQFHSLLLRRLTLWRHAPIDQVITATRMALQLEPGCAGGKPLRLLALAGNDSKFFERHHSLLKALLDVRFAGEASQQGLSAFLGASPEGEHWVLVAPLADGLLPFLRQRVTTTELHATALPCQRILLVENERSLHQLPMPVPGTIAILGSGLNLAWLAAPWLQQRQVAYWGDLDTWGLAMLGIARQHLPHLQPLLMDKTCFAAHAHLAVPEPVHATDVTPNALPAPEAELMHYLRSLEKGRLEQEFLPAHVVAAAIEEWCKEPFVGQDPSFFPAK